MATGDHIARVSFGPDAGRRSVLDRAHRGDVVGAFGSIGVSDTGPRRSNLRKLATLAAVAGPGVIVMVADNDAGSLATFAQGGQDYGFGLLWLLILLGVALFIIQEMVARLGAVTGAGHARLILERFGPRWGSFAMIDLLTLGVLTTMTEFIGVQLGLSYFGISKYISVPASAALLLLLTAGGSFRRWERQMFVLVGVSLIAVPLAVIVIGHHPLDRAGFSSGTGATGTGALFAVGLVGATLAPWQLFFHQSSVVDKRIASRWLNYERADTAIGAVLYVLVAGAVVIVCALAFHTGPLHGQFVDGGTVASGLRRQLGRWAAALFAVALIDGSILGASAVGLASSYAVGDFMGTRHSLHRRWGSARVFYATYAFTIVVAAAAVMGLHGSYGTITLVVQALSGALFPSAAVFLLLLANDAAVLGPHVNRRWLNIASGLVVATILVMSCVLDLTTAFPNARHVVIAIAVASITAAGGAICAFVYLRDRRTDPAQMATITFLHRSSRLSFLGPAMSDESERFGRARLSAVSPAEKDPAIWTMPPIESIPLPRMSRGRMAGMMLLRLYLGLTVVSVIVRLMRSIPH